MHATSENILEAFNQLPEIERAEGAIIAHKPRGLGLGFIDGSPTQIQ